MRKYITIAEGISTNPTSLYYSVETENGPPVIAKLPKTGDWDTVRNGIYDFMQSDFDIHPEQISLKGVGGYPDDPEEEEETNSSFLKKVEGAAQSLGSAALGFHLYVWDYKAGRFKLARKAENPDA